MKKLLSMLAIAGVMVACNSGDDEVTDEDTMTTVQPTYTDTSSMMHDTMMMMDTTTMPR